MQSEFVRINIHPSDKTKSYINVETIDILSYAQLSRRLKCMPYILVRQESTSKESRYFY